ncbi:hypothetical protein [Limnoglobus roseus]|uniref:hypothetical protein n=1 Tax=Limnoglobus roseus TaxID=2598579 RepID=UPI0011EB8AFB|nr:hypothetical protein [Limnoglobus roseus]
MYAVVVRDGNESEVQFRVRDVRAGTVTTQMRFKDATGVCFSPDGTRMAVRDSGLVRVFDTHTREKVGETRLAVSDSEPHTLAISADNRLLLAVFPSWFEVREIATGNMPFSGVPTLGRLSRDAVLSPDGRELCLVHEGEKKFFVEVIDLKTEQRRDLTESQSFYSPTYSRDRRTIFGLRDSELVRIDRATKAVTTLAKGLSRATATKLALSPDGTCLAIGGIRYRLTLHDTVNGRRLPPVEDRFELATNTMEFTADGQKLAFHSDGEDDGYLVDVATGQVLKTVPYNDSTCRFLPNGKDYAIATAKTLQVRGLTDDVAKLKADLDLPWPPAIRSGADGRRLFVNGPKLLQIWDVGTRKELKSHPAEACECSFSPDGRFAVLCPQYGSPHLSTVKLLDLTTGKLHPQWPKINNHHDSRAWGALFDLSGRKAILCHGLYLSIVDLSTFEARQLPRRAANTQMCLPAFSPDARILAVVHEEDAAVHLWETQSGKVRHSIPLTDYAISMAFSTDARLLAIHSTTAPVHLYDLRGTMLDLPKRLDRESLNSLWEALLGDDSKAAFDALRRLAAAPNSTLQFIREKVQPAAAVRAETLTALFESLDAPAFAKREAASKELRGLADTIEIELRASLQQTSSPEVRQRLEKILVTLQPDSPNSVRRVRIVELVEWCGTSYAKLLLKGWAAGASGAALTREAKQALARLGG